MFELRSTKILTRLKQVDLHGQDQLENYFGAEARNPLQFFVKDWRDEPYIGGGPANVTAPGRLQNFHLVTIL
jgi:monoamine oxidase